MRVEISGVSKSFGAAKALENVTASIGPGEVVAVVGLNGAGKSTGRASCSPASPSPAWGSSFSRCLFRHFAPSAW